MSLYQQGRHRLLLVPSYGGRVPANQDCQHPLCRAQREGQPLPRGAKLVKRPGRLRARLKRELDKWLL